MRTTTRISGKIDRFRQLWSELDYVQRRVLENRTGVPFITPAERRQSLLRVRQLEHLYRS